MNAHEAPKFALQHTQTVPVVSLHHSAKGGGSDE